jgi:hypothetical protein
MMINEEDWGFCVTNEELWDSPVGDVLPPLIDGWDDI